jgi:hypothetical protein
MSITHRSAIRLLFVAVLAVFPASLAAQNFVTPTIAQTPGVSPSGLTTGQFTIVNNAAGASYTDPHVSGDLVCYSTSDNNGAFTVRYFNLVTGIDSQIPNPDITQYQDFLCDVRGSAIAFTRASMTTDQIMTFDISVSGAIRSTAGADLADHGVRSWVEHWRRHLRRACFLLQLSMNTRRTLYSARRVKFTSISVSTSTGFPC